MSFNYRLIDYEDGLPIKISFDYSTDEHLHNAIEFIWALQGKLYIQLEDKEYFLKENDLFLINKYTSHKIIESEKEGVYLRINIDPRVSGDYSNKYYSLYSNNTSKDEYETLRFLISQLVYIYKNSSPNKFNKIKEGVIKLMSFLEQNFTIASDSYNSLFEKQKYKIIKDVIEYIDLNYMKEIKLQEIAVEKHYSTSYLSKLFKEIVGINFTDYLDRVRLQSAISSIIYSNKKISQIAYENGFNNLKSFYRVFNRYNNCTPVECRSRAQIDRSNSGKSKLHPQIKKYLSKSKINSINKKEITEKKVLIDFKKTGDELNKVWEKIINIGSATTILNSDIQAQIKETQIEIGFEYLRFEGIFNDEMQVCRNDTQGNISYDWKLVNKVLDTTLDLQLKPFICLNFMPKFMAKNKKKTFYYNNAYCSPPQEISQWLELVDSFIVHCLNRYGLDLVKEWYFQVWSEFSYAWFASDQEYYKFYQETAKVIKNICSSLKVGPASENYYCGNIKAKDLLAFCTANKVPLDFTSSHIYHNYISNKDKLDITKFDSFDEKLMHLSFSFHDRLHTINTIAETKKLISDFYSEIEYMVVQWGISWYMKEYIHDTVFMAAYIVDTALKSRNKIDGLGYLLLSDGLYEWLIDKKPFFGGCGLFTREGIKKPAYYAFYFLSKLGREVIEEGENYIVSKSGDNIQILVYNYSYLNKLYIQEGHSAVSENNRYQAFEKTDTLKMKIKISNIKGKYKLKRYFLNRDNGSAFDEWISLGSEQQLTDEEIKYLTAKSYPGMKIRYIDSQGEFKVSSELEAHGVELILLNKLYEN
ncbi:GH39 family glycosyl hydrolase [Fuchsiella alkaliacetigena]|uniref:GH39 family glycosyl hydrolase n=1 Tax=Fuchsiella alkaliacetigena TaxID=957042 RepID=UPI00200B27CB|nr:helix-turn-helix domain-containing protein [Fuchsiella alkaliacetigena]MCK8824027.1 helix-turn-helix domain-containing protein [Fuchsiella alkaliacetigena]